MAPDLFSTNPQDSAARAFSKYVASSCPDAVVVVVSTGTEPVAAATAIEQLRADYGGPVTLLYGGMMQSRLHRHGGWPSLRDVATTGGPYPITDGWRVVALNPKGNCRYAGAQAIRLARVLRSNVICAGGSSTSVLSVTVKWDGCETPIWAVELGRVPAGRTVSAMELPSFVILEVGRQPAQPQLVSFRADGSFTVDGVEYADGSTTAPSSMRTAA
ncbi:hypothetical protein [Pilimelia anulata]|uniref:hypothetical protein n=1 Tax=Pilimelia anulata TaxID=53371 RepID=UPI00166D63AD|nr:hypothetical protein [Pilimelia anulata]